jgi:hypothetical protein
MKISKMRVVSKVRVPHPPPLRFQIRRPQERRAQQRIREHSQRVCILPLPPASRCRYSAKLCRSRQNQQLGAQLFLLFHDIKDFIPLEE